MCRFQAAFIGGLFKFHVKKGKTVLSSISSPLYLSLRISSELSFSRVDEFELDLLSDCNYQHRVMIIAEVTFLFHFSLYGGHFSEGTFVCRIWLALSASGFEATILGFLNRVVLTKILWYLKFSGHGLLACRRQKEWAVADVFSSSRLKLWFLCFLTVSFFPQLLAGLTCIFLCSWSQCFPSWRCLSATLILDPS